MVHPRKSVSIGCRSSENATISASFLSFSYSQGYFIDTMKSTRVCHQVIMSHINGSCPSNAEDDGNHATTLADNG